MNPQRNSVAAVLAFAAIATSHAQGIQRNAEPYELPSQAIPLARPAARPAAALVAIAAPAATFDVRAGDRSVREVLTRWAIGAGWLFEPQHWTLDKDHPIQGTAGADVFGGEFKTAVRRLLSSTELTDRPVQPCFYVNHVVRVIPKAELCDRTQQ
jgi:hypothetical protein